MSENPPISLLMSKRKNVEEAFTRTLTNRSKPMIVIDDTRSLPEAPTSIGLRPPYPTLAIVGGINIDNAYVSSLKAFFFQVLAPLAQSCQATIVDGGTDSGVIGIMGQARDNINGTFHLVGVLPTEKSIPPTSTPDLEKNHTHFVLTPGT